MQMMDRYAGRTTAQKLGIKAGSKVAVIDAPRDYARVIGALPDEVEFDEESWNGCAVTLWFVEEPEAFLAALPKMRRAAAVSKLWVAWPKKAARKDSLLNENHHPRNGHRKRPGGLQGLLGQRDLERTVLRVEEDRK